MKKLDKDNRGILFFKNLYYSFLHLLFPDNIKCVNCGAELSQDTRYNLCSKCQSQMPFISGHICETCGVEVVGESDYCDNCQRYERYFYKNRAPLIYDGIAKSLVKKLKFGNKKYIAKEFAKMMVDTYISNNYDADLILFVPMTEKDKKERGYNQSELLANYIGERLGIDVIDGLVKIKSTSTQKLLTAKERRENLKGAFCVSCPEKIKNKNILIVDDIFTTGATLNECSKVLKKSGAKKIYGLTACITKFNIEGETNDKAVN